MAKPIFIMRTPVGFSMQQQIELRGMFTDEFLEEYFLMILPSMDNDYSFAIMSEQDIKDTSLVDENVPEEGPDANWEGFKVAVKRINAHSHLSQEYLDEITVQQKSKSKLND